VRKEGTQGVWGTEVPQWVQGHSPGGGLGDPITECPNFDVLEEKKLAKQLKIMVGLKGEGQAQAPPPIRH